MRFLKLYKLAAIAAAALGVLFVSLHKFFDPDELESLYTAWLIFKGQFPYRDFYQIHMPLFYYFLAPLYLFCKSITVITVARMLIYGLLLFNGFLVYRIARRLFGARAAYFGVLAYLLSWSVLSKVVEVRPDILVMIFTNLALLALLNARGHAVRAFSFAGVMTALAACSKQSGMLFFMALVIFFAIRLLTRKDLRWHNDIFSEKRFNLRSLAFFTAAFLATGALFVLFLSAHKALGPFIRYAVNNDFLRLFAGLKIEASHWYPFEYIDTSFCANGIFYLAMLVPVFFILFAGSREHKNIAGPCLFILTLYAVFFFSMLLILHPWSQELIMPGQYLAILAGVALSWLSGLLHAKLWKTGFKFLYVPAVALTVALVCAPLANVVYKQALLPRHPNIGLLRKILALTNKDDRCLSINNACLFRPSVFFYRIGGNAIEGRSFNRSVIDAYMRNILQDSIVVIVDEGDPFRGPFRDILPGLFKVITRHYVLYNDLFYVPGQDLDLEGTTAQIDILVDGYYRFSGESGPLEIDGRPQDVVPVYLARGPHRVSGGAGSQKVRYIYDLDANKK